MRFKVKVKKKRKKKIFPNPIFKMGSIKAAIKVLKLKIYLLFKGFSLFFK
jgi:hypothetical protein